MEACMHLSEWNEKGRHVQWKVFFQNRRDDLVDTINVNMNYQYFFAKKVNSE